VTDDIEYILEHYAPRKSYLRYNGIPVINPFGTMLLTDEEWARIKQTVQDEGYGAFILMSDNAPTAGSYASADATYNWNLLSEETHPDRNPTYDDVYRWAVRNDRATYQWVARDFENRFGVGLAFPGFNDWGVGGDWGSGTARIAAYLTKDDPDHPWMGPADPKGNTLTATQNALLESGPNWIIYATFNDWNEATVFEPSQEFGYRFLQDVQKFQEKWKGLPEADENLMRKITETYLEKLSL
jgi:hypothetical protein